ncbi:unnamed protein product [Lota lota]
MLTKCHGAPQREVAPTPANGDTGGAEGGNPGTHQQWRLTPASGRQSEFLDVGVGSSRNPRTPALKFSLIEEAPGASSVLAVGRLKPLCLLPSNNLRLHYYVHL